MLTEEIPKTLSCSVDLAQEDPLKAMEIAEIFISKVIKLTGSNRKVKDYEISIKDGNAFFTSK